MKKPREPDDSRGLIWWAVQGSNLRPLPCESKKSVFQINDLEKNSKNDNHLAYFSVLVCPSISKCQCPKIVPTT